MLYGRPSSSRARLRSPRASASRTAELDTRVPSFVTVGIASSSKPSLPAAAASDAKSPARFAPIAEIVPDQHPARRQQADQRALDERLRRERRERAREALDVHVVDAVRREQLELLAQRGQPRRRRGGREELPRVRLEGEHARREAPVARDRDQAREHGLVAEVHAVEVADRHGGRRQSPRRETARDE